MPSENSGEQPAGNPNGESPSQAAAIAAIEKRVVALETQTNTGKKENETENLEREIRKGEFWLISVNSLLLIAQIIIACIYYGQLKEMRQATSAATQASQTAKDTLTEMRTGSGAQDTHTLAQQAVTQATQTTKLASNTHDLAVATKRQAEAALVSADATKKMADAAEISAQVSQVALQPAIAVRVVTGDVSADSISFEIRVRNEGGSAALVTTRLCAFFRPDPNPDRTIGDCGGNVRIAGPTPILQHDEMPIISKMLNAAPARNKQSYLFVPVEVTYTYAKVPYTLQRCYVYFEGLKSFGECHVVAQNPKNY